MFKLNPTFIRRTELSLLLFLIPFFSAGQSVSIDMLKDSSGAGGCDTTGEQIQHRLEGSSNGLSSGDTVDIVVDHDDGNGWNFLQEVYVDAQGDFSTTWNHAWNNPGNIYVDVAINGPNGSTDSSMNALRIADSCSTEIISMSDSSGYASCDTTGESIHFHVFGSSTGFDAGDTLDLWVDHDDGNGTSFLQELITGSGGSFSANWSHSWTNPGTKDLTVKVAPEVGDTATKNFQMSITDSCASATITNVSDSSGNGSCHQVGDTVHHHLEGSSSGLSSGDSVQIKVDHDDGSGPWYLWTTVDAQGDYSKDWNHTWWNTGVKNVLIVADPVNGDPDTITHSLSILNGCSMSIDSSSTYDSTTSNSCQATGDSILFQVEGSDPQLSAGDSIEIHADHDDGNGSTFIGSFPVDSMGIYMATWINSWSASGTKNVEIVASNNNGDQDTIYETVALSDSCTDLSIQSFSDSSGGAGCDTTGESISIQLEGSSSGLNTGDTVDVTLYPDSGNTVNLEGYVDAQGDFQVSWSNSWSSTGSKNLVALVSGPNGSSDTAFHSLLISDSCAVWADQASAYDTSSSCYTTGSNIILDLQGSSSGYTSGDSLDLLVDHDDGNGFAFSDRIPVGSNGTYSHDWSHAWSSAGVKEIEMVVNGPNGESDTLQKAILLSDSCATIQGIVHLDQNGDCNYNSGEPRLGNKKVEVTYNNSLVGYATTDASGSYELNVGANQSPYEVTLADAGSYAIACPSSGTQQVSNPPASAVNFGLNCPSSPDFSFDQAHSFPFRPDWESSLFVSISGPSFCSDSLECVKAVLPSELDPIPGDSSMPAYDAVNGDTVVWNMDTMDITDFQSTGGLSVHTDTTAQLGDSLCVEFLLCASSDSIASNNSIQVCEEVVNSWDPNRKQVDPAGEGPNNLIAQGQELTYTIDFQNTGNAPAIDIRVEDTLDADVLDPNSFSFLGSSHQVDRIDIQEDSIFSFHFDDIMLPDSGTSMAGSKGFVRFTVDQRTGLSGGTVIRNNAAIFFDQNPPVITNSTSNRIESSSSLLDEKASPSLSIHPNPARDRLHLRSGDDLQGSAILRDLQGKKVLGQRLSGTRNSLRLEGLPDGIYILSVRFEGKEDPVRKKVVIR